MAPMDEFGVSVEYTGGRSWRRGRPSRPCPGRGSRPQDDVRVWRIIERMPRRSRASPLVHRVWRIIAIGIRRVLEVMMFTPSVDVVEDRVEVSSCRCGGPVTRMMPSGGEHQLQDLQLSGWSPSPRGHDALVAVEDAHTMFSPCVVGCARRGIHLCPESVRRCARPAARASRRCSCRSSLQPPPSRPSSSCAAADLPEHPSMR